MGLTAVRSVDIPRVCDPRGNLSFIENGASCLPFVMERAYWIYDVPSGRTRTGHAFQTAQELIVALSGSFDIEVTDGTETRRYHMSRPCTGLYIPAMTWREIDNFSTNAVALVLSSTLYDERDYIRDFGIYTSYLPGND